MMILISIECIHFPAVVEEDPEDEGSNAGKATGADGECRSGERYANDDVKPRTGRRGGKDRPAVKSASTGNIRAIIHCSVCSKTFNNSSALAKHKLIHSDERKYTCATCGKAFKRQDHL